MSLGVDHHPQRTNCKCGVKGSSGDEDLGDMRTSLVVPGLAPPWIRGQLPPNSPYKSIGGKPQVRQPASPIIRVSKQMDLYQSINVDIIVERVSKCVKTCRHMVPIECESQWTFKQKLDMNQK